MGFAEGCWARLAELHGALEHASVGCIRSSVPLREEGHKDRPEPQPQQVACPPPHLRSGQQRNPTGHSNTNRVLGTGAGRSLAQRRSEACAANTKPGNQGPSSEEPQQLGTHACCLQDDVFWSLTTSSVVSHL